MWGLLAILFGGAAIKSKIKTVVPQAQPDDAVTGTATKAPVMTKTLIEALAWAKFKANARANEGYRLTVYKDHLGVLTVGIGHKVTSSDNLKLGSSITAAKADSFFYADALKAFEAAKKNASDLGKYTPDFIAALAEVNFQLGTGWKSTFKNTYNFLKTGQITRAVSNLKNSLWSKQTPDRVENFIEAIRTSFDGNSVA